MPVNTDGGLIANGEPVGASGLRQVHELVRQLRGQAGDRQVPGDPKVGYAQLYGAPGTAGRVHPEHLTETSFSPTSGHAWAARKIQALTIVPLGSHP